MRQTAHNFLAKRNCLRQAEADLRAKLAQTVNFITVPAVGTVLFVNVRKLSIPMLILRADDRDLWDCCKLSLNIHEAIDHDLIIRTNPALSRPIVVEAWNAVSLHVDDMGYEFFPVFTDQEVRWGRELLRSYTNFTPIPAQLRFITGTPFQPEIDSREDHYMQEMSIVELIRLKFHEGYE